MKVRNKEKWATPADLFELLEREFGFELDVCAERETAKCAVFFAEEDDGLLQSWGGKVCFMNPPYTLGVIGKWIAKAIEECKKGATVVAVVRGDNSTKWWYLAFVHAAEVRLLSPGRVKFGDGKGTPNFPTHIMIFTPQSVKRPCEDTVVKVWNWKSMINTRLKLNRLFGNFSDYEQ